MIKPKAIVFAGYGLNCEEETAYAFNWAGAEAKIVHVNDVIATPTILDRFQIMTVPGGFAYGDDTGSGNAYALKMKNHLWEKIVKFIKKDSLVIGICNGFQVLVNLGLLPALNGAYGQRQVALTNNNSARYTVRWVDLKVKNQTPWLAGINRLSLPIAHGEGKFTTDTKTLLRLKKKNLIAVKYVKGEVCNYQLMEGNPNGSLDDIAGITDETGRVFGLMPHPERAIFFNQLPQWPYLKEKFLREGKQLPEAGPGLKIFQNAINYFQ